MTTEASPISHPGVDRDTKMGTHHSYPEEGSSRSESRFRLIDLFAGAGGMSLGFSESFGHNFEPVWANDFNEYAAATYNRNFGPHCAVGDIVELLANKNIQIPQADVVIGGPPCQGFSLLNKQRSGDRRKQLWRPFLDVVALSGTQIFVMENVPQLLGSEFRSDAVTVG
jgi:DNA (cytosine-5)-methyltransferase 1